MSEPAFSQTRGSLGTGPGSGAPVGSAPTDNGLPGTGSRTSVGATVGELATRIERLSGHFGEVVGQLAASFKGMSEPGRPPSYHVLNSLGDCHRQFLKLRQSVVRLSEANGVPIPPVDELADLDSLRRLLGLPKGEVVAVDSPGLNPEFAPSRVDPSLGSAPVSTEVLPLEALPEDLNLLLIDKSAEPHSAFESIDAERGWPEPVLTPLETEPQTLPEPGDTSAMDATPWPPHSATDLVHGAVDAIHHVEPDALTPPEPAEGPIREAALDLLERAQRLALRDGVELPELRACLDQAVALREAILASPPDRLPEDAHRLAGGDHPLARLLTAVERPDEISDTAWAELHVVVVESYGRPLALAMARQRLILKEASG